jgi:hypothetical protein
MALSAQTAWEVRPTNGSDTNGGGFVAGSTGTDWSTQNAAQYAKTDIVTNGTTTITSATSNWGTDVVGNIIYIAGGTGSLAGVWRQIVTRVSASNLTLDASTGLAASTGCTGNVGGALHLCTGCGSGQCNSVIASDWLHKQQDRQRARLDHAVYKFGVDGVE